MQKNELKQEQLAENDQPAINECSELSDKQQKQEQNSMSPNSKRASEAQTQKQTSHSCYKETQVKKQTSLDSISVESPIKKSITKNQYQKIDKSTFSQNKTLEKKQSSTIKQKRQVHDSSLSNNTNQSGMKLTIKSVQKVKKVNKPFYEETFYITGMKQNYLLLLSDNNQVLEFPIGMFTSQGGANFQEEQGQRDNHQNMDQFHLIKDIKIGQAIKIKLEFDFFRQQKDDKLFSSLQKKIHEEYSEIQDETMEVKNKDKSPKRKAI